jgi:hypothetical protein
LFSIPRIVGPSDMSIEPKVRRVLPRVLAEEGVSGRAPPKL